MTMIIAITRMSFLCNADTHAKSSPTMMDVVMAIVMEEQDMIRAERKTQ